MDGHFITTLEELGEFYSEPSGAVIRKEMDRLDKSCRAFIAASPFLMLATSGGAGVDCSPRGDGAGFVRVTKDGEILLPDRAGNNRLDSLRNIVENPRVGLLFLVPGANHTLRVNGTAKLSVEPELLEGFAVKGRLPRSVTIVEVEKAFVQCARALQRADLWNPGIQGERSYVPSLGEMLSHHTQGEIKADEFDEFDRTTLSKNLY